MLDKLRAFVQSVQFCPGGMGKVTKVLCRMTKVGLDIWTNWMVFVQSLEKRLWTFGQIGWTLCPFVQSVEKSIIMDFLTEVRFNGPG